MRRLLVIATIVLAGLVLVGLAAVRLSVSRSASGRVYDVGSAPTRSVGIVFGAGIGSDMLRDRVATGVELYRAHKVKHLLLSGDNRRRSYDEPRAMRKLALESGVPASALVLDYAGRRTFDSCARARDVFRLDDAILVTQDFHLPRALYLCGHLGLPEVVGVAADRREYRSARWLWMREVFASARAFLDVHVRRPPVVGGPALPIEDREPPAPAVPPAAPAPEDDGDDDGDDPVPE